MSKQANKKISPAAKPPAVIIGITFIAILLGFIILNQWHDDIVEKNYEAVKTVTIDRSTEGCRTSVENNAICDDMEVTISESECDARVCWISYATPSNDRSAYYASMIVEKHAGSYTISHFTDSTTNTQGAN